MFFKYILQAFNLMFGSAFIFENYVKTVIAITVLIITIFEFKLDTIQFSSPSNFRSGFLS